MITNHSLLEQLRRNAYATAQIYSWAKIAQKNLGLYEQACQQKCDR
ncbi:hypothetical protein [Floridanema evergladense]|uniref:Uncharacterized protein n=1 Tax=Floridaenema evergladense BLCC-F167 TaxID=3153639 RepID=A0ABV4WXB1_9CYAN